LVPIGGRTFSSPTMAVLTIVTIVIKRAIIISNNKSTAFFHLCRKSSFSARTRSDRLHRLNRTPVPRNSPADIFWGTRNPWLRTRLKRNIILMIDTSQTYACVAPDREHERDVSFSAWHDFPPVITHPCTYMDIVVTNGRFRVRNRNRLLHGLYTVR
jgi:hypothetical protein